MLHLGHRPQAGVDGTIVKALVPAHRWRGMPESKLLSSARDLAKAEKINEAYLSCVSSADTLIAVNH
jgi:hypothetical protein